MTVITPPDKAGFYWFRYDNLSSRVHYRVLLEVVQMQPVRWMNQLVPLEQMPEGLWRGPIADLR
jgi:hypothetical protein